MEHVGLKTLERVTRSDKIRQAQGKRVRKALQGLLAVCEENLPEWLLVRLLTNDRLMRQLRDAVIAEADGVEATSSIKLGMTVENKDVIRFLPNGDKVSLTGNPATDLGPYQTATTLVIDVY